MGLFVVWEEVLGLNRARHLEITQGSFTAQQGLSWGAVAEVCRAQELLGRLPVSRSPPGLVLSWCLNLLNSSFRTGQPVDVANECRM